VLESEQLASLPLAGTDLALTTLLAQRSAWTNWIARGPSAGEIERVLHDPALLHLLHPPTLAIVGVPNAGKSTLANAIFGTKRSIVSDIPGTTRDWVGETANIEGLRVQLLDTPGLRDSDDAIEQSAITVSADAIRQADLVLILIDGSADRAAQHRVIEQFSRQPHLQVINKSDALHPHWQPSTLLKISAPEEVTLAPLRESILRVFGCHDIDRDRPRCWTRRQHELLRGAIVDRGSLQEILEAVHR
jgi:tRNA modification GTPase